MKSNSKSVKSFDYYLIKKLISNFLNTNEFILPLQFTIVNNLVFMKIDNR